MVGAALKALSEMQYFLSGTGELTRSRSPTQHAGYLSIMLSTGDSRRLYHWHQDTAVRKMHCSGSSTNGVSWSLAMGFSNPMVEEHYANRREDSTTQRPSRRKGDLRRARTCPNASCPSSRANGADAIPTRSLRTPV